MTNRDSRLPEASTASSGAVRIHAQTIAHETGERLELVDLTPRVTDVVRASGVGEGTVNVWSMHTTCGLMINEHQQALLADIARLLDQLVARDAGWLHNDPAHSDCDRFNADSHLRAMLVGHSVTLQVSGGEPVLGQWQRILLVELDGPRTRNVRIQVTGLV